MPPVKDRIILTSMEDPLPGEGQPLFTQAELAALEEIGHTIRRSAGNAFMLEGEYGDFALLIKKGYVKVVASDPSHVGAETPSPKSSRVVAIRGPGAMVGENALLGKPRSASVYAFDDVEALYLPAARLRGFLLTHARASFAMWAAERGRTEQATRKIVESELAIGRQLAVALVELADSGLGERTSEKSTVLRLRQEDLAELIGATKIHSVKKVIQLLKASGTIATGRGKIVILDLATLRTIADGDLPVS